jgi:hypothetical protein
MSAATDPVRKKSDIKKMAACLMNQGQLPSRGTGKYPAQRCKLLSEAVFGRFVGQINRS